MGRGRLHEVLVRIEERVAADQVPIVVFDLDSTLLSTAPRNLEIFREFVAIHGSSYQVLVDVADTITLDDMGWETMDALRARGVRDAALFDHFERFWAERFFSGAYVVHDRPNPGAAEFAWACHRRGALIYYLTGRHRGGMEAATAQSLGDQGFPYWTARTVLHLKPRAQMRDTAFKKGALADIRSHRSPVVATFENEPANANLFREGFPDALHFWLQTVHSKAAERPHADLIAIEHFELP